MEYCFVLQTSMEKAASQTVTLGDSRALDVPGKKKIPEKKISYLYCTAGEPKEKSVSSG